jgi:hypothetical protein
VASLFRLHPYREISLCCTLLGLVAGCATLPHERAERAVYLDLRKAIQLSEDSGFVIERVQLRANEEQAMRSVCQVEPALLDDLEAWLTSQIALAGGPADQRYRENGGDLGAISETLTLERTRTLLRHARSHAASDCPFWLRPSSHFEGVQGDAGRFVALAETHAYASYVFDAKIPALGGGGRVFLGHGLGPRWTLAVGGELAASGQLVTTHNSGRAVTSTFSAALPVLLRLSRFSRLFDIELAPVMRFDPGQNGLPPGGRVELGVGLSTMRSSTFMPYAMLYMGYEHHLHTSTRNADNTLQIGTRLALDWAP